MRKNWKHGVRVREYVYVYTCTKMHVCKTRSSNVAFSVLYFFSRFIDLYHYVDRIRILDNGNLVINNVKQEDVGEYQCFASNVAGTRESHPALVTVHGRFGQYL